MHILYTLSSRFTPSPQFFTIFTHFTPFTLYTLLSFRHCLPLLTTVHFFYTISHSFKPSFTPIHTPHIPRTQGLQYFYFILNRNLIDISYLMPCLIICQCYCLYERGTYILQDPHMISTYTSIYDLGLLYHHVEPMPSIGFSTHTHLKLHTITLTLDDQTEFSRQFTWVASFVSPFWYLLLLIT